MKNMKLIMENFRKSMKEGWPGEPKVEVPWANADKEANAEKMGAWMQRSKESREKTEVLERAAASAVKEILHDFQGKYSDVNAIVRDKLEPFDTNELKAYCERHLADEVARTKNMNMENFSESDILAMIDEIDAFRDPDEPEEREEKSDMEDNPGVSVGQDAKWK
jgi:hypothetical protein